MVNGPKTVYVERSGRIALTDLKFSDDAAVMQIAERFLGPLGLRVDKSVPYADGRLSDGSRLHVIIPPLAVDGPVITIRRFTRTLNSIEDLVENGSINESAAKELAEAVRNGKNVLVSGGTATGKTTLLNALAACIPAGERIITIEDTAELNLSAGHVIRLESRPDNIEGKGGITIRDLVRTSLRMRPDRIIVGEVRGPEALDMLQAMNTGHAGSMSTIHANSCRDALKRLEVMALMADIRLPTGAVGELAKAAIDLVVQLEHRSNGARGIRETMYIEADRHE